MIWYQRIVRYIKSIKNIKGIPARINYLIWGFKRLIQLVIPEFASNDNALANLLASPPFILSGVERSGHNLVITGILIPITRDGELNLELRVNGESFDHIDWNESSKDVQLFYGFLSGIGKCRFTATIIGERLKGVRSLRLEAVDTKTGKPVNPYQFHELPLEPMPSNLPDEKAQLRVMGWANDFLFWTYGRSHMRAIAELITKYRNDVDWSLSSMLDWGCGCGRISRHFLENEELRLKRLVGVDIDPVNIQWCKENLKGAEFHVTDLLPPLPFENESFDFIHGNSVFTHLNSENQDLWLTELCRVLKPNGIGVITINSGSALAHGRASPILVSNWQKEGIFISGHNTNVDEVIDDHDYYTDTFHTHKYVDEHWSKFFEVLAIHEMVFGYQDAVILRKR